MRVKVAKSKAKRIKGAFNFLVINSQKCKENTCQFDRKPKGKLINLAVIKPPRAAWLVCDDEVLLVLHELRVLAVQQTDCTDRRVALPDYQHRLEITSARRKSGLSTENKGNT